MSNKTVKPTGKSVMSDLTNAVEQGCRWCGLAKSDCTCEKGYMKIGNYQIKESLTDDEFANIYVETIDVYLDGTTSNGEPVKDYRSQTGFNRATCMVYLKQRLMSTCIKDYDANKNSEYLENNTLQNIIAYTKRAGDLYSDICTYIDESKSLLATTNKILDVLPDMIKKILEAKAKIEQENLSVAMKNLEKAEKKHSKIMKLPATPTEEIILNSISAMTDKKVKGTKGHKDLNAVIKDLMNKDPKTKSFMEAMGIKPEMSKAAFEQVKKKYSVK